MTLSRVARVAGQWKVRHEHQPHQQRHHVALCQKGADPRTVGRSPRILDGVLAYLPPEGEVCGGRRRWGPCNPGSGPENRGKGPKDPRRCTCLPPYFLKREGGVWRPSAVGSAQPWERAREPWVGPQEPWATGTQEPPADSSVTAYLNCKTVWRPRGSVVGVSACGLPAGCGPKKRGRGPKNPGCGPKNRREGHPPNRSLSLRSEE